MLLIVGQGIRGGISHAIHGNATANNNAWENTTRTMNHHIIPIWMQTIYIDGYCLKNYLLTVLNGRKVRLSSM